MSFENLIGNNRAKETLTNIIKSNRVMHSYMFIGPSGIGKSLFAKKFAEMILCEEVQNKPCNKCKSCIELKNNNHPDLIEILPENDVIKIEQIRKMRRKDIRKTNNFRKKGIYNKSSRYDDKRSRKLFVKNIRRTAQIHNNNINRFK